MYAVAGRLDPDSYFALARATYREMAAAGITAVGEFHYLHHRPTARRTTTPTRWAHALSRRPARPGSGSRLLDTCYLSSGFGAPPEGVAGALHRRRRATPGRAGSTRRAATTPGVGAAIHSVRAVPRDAAAAVVAAAAARRCTCTSPSRSPRTTPAWRRTASPRPSCSPTPALLGPRTTRRARHPPDRRRHRAPRRRAAPTPASARPPSATSATASGRRARLHDAGLPAHPRLRQPRGDRPVRGDARPSSSTSGWPPSSAATGPPPSC